MCRVATTPPCNCLSAAAAPDKCRAKVNRIERGNTQHEFDLGTVECYANAMGTKRHEESPLPPLIFMCVHHFWLCAAYVHQTRWGFRREKEKKKTIQLDASCFLAFFSLKKKKKMQMEMSMMLSTTAAFRLAGRILEAKTNKRSRRKFELRMRMPTNYLGNWNYRDCVARRQEGNELCKREWSWTSWNVCDECWQSSFNYSSTAAGAAYPLDASMHSRESLYIFERCLSLSLSRAAPCSLLYSTRSSHLLSQQPNSLRSCKNEWELSDPWNPFFFYSRDWWIEFFSISYRI